VAVVIDAQRRILAFLAQPQEDRTVPLARH
jgi:hypothetical protein